MIMIRLFHLRSFAITASCLLIIIVGAVRCTYEVVPEPANCDAAPQVRLVAKSDASCGVTNGRIEVRVEGGSEGYAFRINDKEAQADGTFTALAAGTYVVSATDANGCRGELTVSVNNRDGVNMNVTATEASCGATDGRLRAEVSGGEAPFRFRLNGGATQSTGVYNALAPGEYEVSVEDASGCTVTQRVEVRSGIAFATIQPIIETNCAVSGCHNGSVAPNFTSVATIQDRAARIKARTSAKTMPPPSSGRTLTEAQIEQLACWVDGNTQ